MFATFASLVEAFPATPSLPSTCRSACRILPAAAGAAGTLVRPLLGGAAVERLLHPLARRRPCLDRAVHHGRGWYEAHRRASEIARKTSDPPRGVSIQAFGIFPKIREIDALLIERPELRRRVVESHPEVAFWRLNDCQPMRCRRR